MTDKETSPLPRDAIQIIDALWAKCFLLAELCQIPEFVHLWEEARELPSHLMPVFLQSKERWKGLSPEARGAYLMGAKAYGLYDEQVIKEAEAFAHWLDSLFILINKALQERGIETDYRKKLAIIIEPLHIPDLIDFIGFLDLADLGFLDEGMRSLPIAGPARDLLEAGVIRELTGFSPTELALAKPAQVRKRIKRRIAPLERHLKRYQIQQRVHLWVQNVVLGQSIQNIADELERSKEKIGVEACPYRWVVAQIREASQLLGAKRPAGRPKKGGGLRLWKLMAK